MVVIGAPTWLMVMVMPRLNWRWAAIRVAGRLLAFVTRVGVTVTGRVPDTGSLVVVANHQSFVDALLVILVLRAPAAFAAGGELATQHIAGPFLRRLDTEFVAVGGRPSVVRAEMDRLSALLRQGRRLVFFPEGSLAQAPGLRRFRMGAFVLAARAGVPVVPIGITGSGGVVRPGGKFPRRGHIRVAVGVPILAQGPQWSAAVDLRHRAHRAVSELSGETELDGA
ncbi:MAG TPA: lysophospholipid acyltransferase family protein [Acidimicrobiales bacterium]|nr:lysophospholipid acyltransferase family protein [Acidimicrobiales bacterium]